MWQLRNSNISFSLWGVSGDSSPENAGFTREVKQKLGTEQVGQRSNDMNVRKSDTQGAGADR